MLGIRLLTKPVKVRLYRRYSILSRPTLYAFTFLALYVILLFYPFAFEGNNLYNEHRLKVFICDLLRQIIHSRWKYHLNNLFIYELLIWILWNVIESRSYCHPPLHFTESYTCDLLFCLLSYCRWVIKNISARSYSYTFRLLNRYYNYRNDYIFCLLKSPHCR